MSLPPAQDASKVEYRLEPGSGVEVTHLIDVLEQLHAAIHTGMPGQVIRDIQITNDRLVIGLGPA
jgi:hypothetical protein